MKIFEYFRNSPAGDESHSLYVTINSISGLKSAGFTDSDGDMLTVIIPESSLDIVLNSLSEIKNRYILFDFGDFSSIQKFLSLPEPVFVLKYDYIKSFEAVLSYSGTGKGKKNVCSLCFETK